MNKNVKVVYQAHGEGLMVLTYDGNELVDYYTIESYCLWDVPEQVRFAFGIKNED